MNYFLKHKTSLSWLLIILSASILHLPYLCSYFFMDDFWHLALLVKGDYIFSTWTVGRETLNQLWFLDPKVFPQMAGMESMQYYFRPVYLMSLWFDHALFGFYAPGYHLQNQLWHVANALLLFSLLKKMGINYRICLFSAAIFGMHPAVSESVSWISARCYLQVLFFILSSTICYFEYRESSKIHWLIAHVLLFILAIGSHESAIILPIALMIFELFGNRKSLESGLYRFAWGFVALIAISFFFWRISNTGDSQTWSMTRANFSSFMDYGSSGVLGYNMLQYFKLLLSGLLPVSFLLFSEPFSVLPYGLIFLLGGFVMLYSCFKLRQSLLMLPALLAFGFLAAILWLPGSTRYFYPALAFFIPLLLSLIKEVFCVLKPVFKGGLQFVLVCLLCWFIVASSILSLSTLASHTVLERSMNSIISELDANPQVTDLYLLHLWPLMANSTDLIPALALRPNLKIHLLTYSSSLYIPDTSQWIKKLILLTQPYDPSWFLPVTTSNKALNLNTVVLSSKPVGFFTGSSTFGWPVQHIPNPPKGRIRLDDMDVKFGAFTRKTGVSSLMFTLKKPLNDPSHLWLEFKDGNIKRWRP